MSGWIAVDLDGTIAQYAGWMGAGSIGSPVQEMSDRVKRWQDKGVEVRIFTARAGDYDHWCFAEKQGLFNGPFYNDYMAKKNAIYDETIKPIEDWCEKHFGQRFRVTAMKDYAMVELWDDRAVRVEMNTGKVVQGK